MIIIIIIIGVININNIKKVESEKSSYTKTTFDYFISSPNQAQVDEIKASASVEAILPCYALNNTFTQNKETKEIFLLASSDMKDYAISLFNDQTLISGKYEEDAIMLDELAAKKLGVKVGDEVTFSILGTKLKRKVAGIYLTSTYGTLTTGIALIKYASDIENIYKPHAYSFAFIKANDKDGVETLLHNYVGEGNVALSYEEYVQTQVGAKPPYQTEEEYENECQNKYQQYRSDIIASALASGAQVASKEDSYLLIKDKVHTTEVGINNLKIITGIGVLFVFAIFSIVFILTNQDNDKINVQEGLAKGKMLLNHYLVDIIEGIVIFVITFIVLLLVAKGTHFLIDAMSSILWMTIPVLISLALVLTIDLLYILTLYN